MINESDISFIACVEDSSMCVTNLYFVQLGMPRKTSIINCHFDTLGLHEGWFQVVGSCNGLLCIKGYGNVFNSFYVCNPITREFMILPDNTVVSNGGMANYGGFGFDAATGEYKVVFMYYAHAIGLGQQQGHEPVKTYMLTLGTTAWEYIGEAPAQPYRNSCVLVNGALHWRTRPRNKSGVYIVAFDIASKEFAVVPPPPIRHVLDAFDWTLCNLGGHLAVVTFDRARISNVVNVWEMSEYKVESSWHKTEVPELKYGPLKVDVGLLPESLHPSSHYAKLKFPWKPRYTNVFKHVGSLISPLDAIELHKK